MCHVGADAENCDYELLFPVRLPLGCGVCIYCSCDDLLEDIALALAALLSSM